MLYKEENIQHNKNSKTTENMPEEVSVYLFSALRSMHVYIVQVCNVHKFRIVTKMDDGIYCCIKNTSFDLNNKNDTRHCDIIAQKQFHSHINGRKREKKCGTTLFH